MCTYLCSVNITKLLQTSTECQSYTHLTNCTVWGKSYRKLRRYK